MDGTTAGNGPAHVGGHRTADAPVGPLLAHVGDAMVNRFRDVSDVDLVAVTVKVPSHAAVVRAALAAGKHVLSEWPLGVDLAEASALADLARSAGTVHAVGLQGLHSTGARFVADLIADGGSESFAPSA